MTRAPFCGTWRNCARDDKRESMAKKFGPRVSSSFDYLIHESGKSRVLIHRGKLSIRDEGCSAVKDSPHN